MLESVDRIEPARLERLSAPVADLVAEVSAASATLGRALHPTTAAHLADLVRIMNSYYSNLIEGHATRPRDIESALAGKLVATGVDRDLHLEAAAHVRLQAQIDRSASMGMLGTPTSVDFIRNLHREFYAGLPDALLVLHRADRDHRMIPGMFRSEPGDDVVVGRHRPPTSSRVSDFMRYFAYRFDSAGVGLAGRITAIAAAHHRLNYIHPFPDGNGRVSRLMSHAMAHDAGIGAGGLWSISRGLARGIERRGEYMTMMDLADAPRRGDLDGRGNLSEAALEEFTTWFLRVCLDQIAFMTRMFDFDSFVGRLRLLVERDDRLKPEASKLLENAFVRGSFERGEAASVTGLPERSARRVLQDTLDAGLLASATPKGRVSLRFPAATLDVLFPALYSAA